VDSKSKFIYGFDIYCSKSKGTLESMESTRKEQDLAHRIITNLAVGLKNKGHMVILNSYFINIGISYNLKH
jgi:hypothetical protein